MGGASTSGVQRRLAAILAADVVGYSRLMGQDEEGTLQRVKRLRRDILQPRIEAHRGRIFKSVGDGFLAAFSSPVEAVRCALEVQAILAEEARRDTSQALVIRIGINLGDIIVEDDGDVYGDGVNIAARLEQLADPGGICMSGSVFDQVDGKIDTTFESRGEQQVKNIAKAVKVYALTGPGTPLTLTASKALPLPDKPSIAVLPFTNMSGDPEQEYFADGMTDDIITGLSRLTWLFVIARNSTATYKGRATDVRQVARELGVQYILEGSVRAFGTRIRVTSQLIDASSGRHLWADRYDRQVADIFVLQDELTESVVGAIEPQLYLEEGFKASKISPEKISSWGLVARAVGLISKLGREANREARSLLEKAIASQPDYAKALAQMSWATWWAAFNYWLPSEEEGRAIARKYAEDALAIDPHDPWARMVLGLCLSTIGNHDRALRELETALRLNPSFALGHAIYGWGLLHSGGFDTAVHETRYALRLSPRDSFLSFYEWMHGFALLGDRQFDEALPYLEKALVAFPEFPSQYTLLVSCCGHLGMIDEAMFYLTQRNKLDGPKLTVSLNRTQLRLYACGNVIAEGLAKAGVPER
jgi:adenylate cyclase